MILKQIDFLSPEITLYYKGSLSHKSIISGILTIIALVLIIMCTICYINGFLNKRDEVPKIASYTRFIEDAGEFPINSSSFFHFISLYKDKYNGFDFTYFNIIGFEQYNLYDYDNNNLYNYNHWLYGFCNYETDTIGISNIVTQDYFLQSACIRKYYDSSSKEYYNPGDPKFKWPKMAHGNFNSNMKFYSIIIQNCEQNLLNEIFDDEKICKNENEVKEELNGVAIYFNFIDYYVDILKYENPNQKYFYRLENTLDKDNYSINHLNFNPSVIKTTKGFMFYKTYDELSYVYERNEVYTYQKKGKIQASYNLWLNNRMHYYERTYRRIQDALSDIGGVANSIIFIITLINNLINRYTIITDTQKLLNSTDLAYEESTKKKKNSNR